MYHVIPDIHGQADKLDALLAHLGWRATPAGWQSPDPTREIVFLGDFIDRGPENARVIKTVRSLMESGKARAIMGNHEFNAVHFHTEVEGRPLREHSKKNLHQHASFLREYPVGTAQTTKVIEWMKTLPLFLDEAHFRAVHACWHDPSLDRLRTGLADGRITDDMLRRADWKEGQLFDALQKVTSGLEVPLPKGASFHDKDGVLRRHVRIGWWVEGATTWREIARSVPEPDRLPAAPLPQEIGAYCYNSPVPVFFGHYWLEGAPRVEARHALCLDYSAGKDGPLICYEFDPSCPVMSVDRIRRV